MNSECLHSKDPENITKSLQGRKIYKDQCVRCFHEPVNHVLFRLIKAGYLYVWNALMGSVLMIETGILLIMAIPCLLILLPLSKIKSKNMRLQNWLLENRVGLWMGQSIKPTIEFIAHCARLLILTDIMILTLRFNRWQIRNLHSRNKQRSVGKYRWIHVSIHSHCNKPR